MIILGVAIVAVIAIEMILTQKNTTTFDVEVNDISKIEVYHQENCEHINMYTINPLEYRKVVDYLSDFKFYPGTSNINTDGGYGYMIKIYTKDGNEYYFVRDNDRLSFNDVNVDTRLYAKYDLPEYNDFAASLFNDEDPKTIYRYGSYAISPKSINYLALNYDYIFIGKLDEKVDTRQYQEGYSGEDIPYTYYKVTSIHNLKGDIEENVDVFYHGGVNADGDTELLSTFNLPDEGKYYLFLVNKVDLTDPRTIENSVEVEGPHLMVLLEGYDASKGYDQQKQEVDDLIQEYIDAINFWE